MDCFRHSIAIASSFGVILAILVYIIALRMWETSDHVNSETPFDWRIQVKVRPDTGVRWAFLKILDTLSMHPSGWQSQQAFLVANTASLLRIHANVTYKNSLRRLLEGQEYPESSGVRRLSRASFQEKELETRSSYACLRRQRPVHPPIKCLPGEFVKDIRLLTWCSSRMSLILEGLSGAFTYSGSKVSLRSGPWRRPKIASWEGRSGIAYGKTHKSLLTFNPRLHLKLLAYLQLLFVQAMQVNKNLTFVAHRISNSSYIK